MSKLNKKKLNYYKSLNIDTNNKYFRAQYRRGLLDDIDENFVKEVQNYYKEHYKKEIDPVTHIAFANLMDNKEVRIIPQQFYRKKFLSVFNDNAMNDMYRDKGLYDVLIPTDKKVYNVIKYSRGQFIKDTNVFIEPTEALDILLHDQNEYIIKPSDTNNGQGITKLYVRDNELFINNKKTNLKQLQELFGYNYVIQHIIQQHDIMAKPHPQSVNTLRMATIRWNGKIRNLYTFARFGHSGDIKDNAGAGGLVVGVKENGQFMDYGITRSRVVHEHPTSHVKIKDFGTVPNMDKINQFVRELHENILLQNYVAWDIAISPTGEPIFIENNFYGSSWTNQIALNSSMFGELTDEVLKYIHENENITYERNVKSISARRRRNMNRLRRSKNKSKRLTQELNASLREKDNQISVLKKEISNIKKSRSWRYTRLFRK